MDKFLNKNKSNINKDIIQTNNKNNDINKLDVNIFLENFKNNNLNKNDYSNEEMIWFSKINNNLTEDNIILLKSYIIAKNYFGNSFNFNKTNAINLQF